MSDAKPDIKADQKEAAQSLADVLAQTFSVRTDQEFADRFAGLVVALINAKPVFVFAKGPNDETPVRLSGVGRADDKEILAAVALRAFGEGREKPMRDEGLIVTRLALPSGMTGAVILAMPQGTQIVQALAHERISTLQALAAASFQNTEVMRIRSALAAAHGLSNPTDEALQNFVDQTATLTEAEFVAIGSFDGKKIGHVTVSGQGSGKKRAALPDRLKRDLQTTGMQKLVTPSKQFMGGEGQDHGLVLVVEGMERNAELVPLLASTVRIAAPRARAKKPFLQRARGWAVAALILIGVIAVPLPDGTKLSATVTAENFRIITAPYSAAIVDVAVADNQTVVGDETVLARLDATDTVNELIASQADFAAALLEREGARADRNAAALRSAELEAERIAARITLLEAQQEAATLIAPISGLVIGPDLQGRRGSVVSQGDVLMQIADPAAFRLDLNIQQDQLATLAPDTAGVFRPDFDPSLAFDVTLTAISPAALDTNRVPVFPGQASLPNDTAELRHGMTGVVSVNREWRPAGLLLWDAIRDWFLLRLWL